MEGHFTSLSGLSGVSGFAVKAGMVPAARVDVDGDHAKQYGDTFLATNAGGEALGKAVLSAAASRCVSCRSLIGIADRSRVST
jgi:hypothetical protein